MTLAPAPLPVLEPVIREVCPPAAEHPACPLRVLMVLKRPGGLGGMQLQAERVAARMRWRGVPVKLVCQERSTRRPACRRRLVPRVFLEGRYVVALHRYLLHYREAYDVVHVHGLGEEAFAAMAASRWTGKPLLVKPSTAGVGTRLHRYGPWFRLLPGLLSQVDRWVSISRSTTADLGRMGVPDRRILSIPNRVDATDYHALPTGERRALRRSLGLTERDHLVCTAARLSPHKQVDVLLRAFDEAAASDERLHLWVLGDGVQRRELEALSAGLRAGKRVRFRGVVSRAETCAAFQCADVFALLSRWEGLPNALLEAMACGAVPLVTDVSGMQDVVQHCTSGLMVPPGDVEATANALRYLSTNEALRAELGWAASDRIRCHYTLDRTVDELLQEYASVVAERSVRS
jgi:glycosyltransferase involved in cell wall biosynthesis